MLGSVFVLQVSASSFSTSWAVDSQQVTEMIAKADSYPWTANRRLKWFLWWRYIQDEQLDKTRGYNVYTRPNRESVVVFKSAVEAGQKMLMIEDNYWLLMPKKSRRPIRITPMQKLLGEASVGDISTLTWSEDCKVSGLPSNKLRPTGETLDTPSLKARGENQGGELPVDWSVVNSRPCIQLKRICICVLENWRNKLGLRRRAWWITSNWCRWPCSIRFSRVRKPWLSIAKWLNKAWQTNITTLPTYRVTVCLGCRWASWKLPIADSTSSLQSLLCLPCLVWVTRLRSGRSELGVGLATQCRSGWIEERVLIQPFTIW